MSVRASWCATALVLSSCSTNVNVTPASVPPDAVQPRDAKEVAVFGGGNQPTRPYLKSVVLEVPARGTQADITKALREKAGGAGCDAILLDSAPGRADCIIYERQ